MNGLGSPHHHIGRWVSGSIRRKLTGFVVLICLMLVSLFWALSVFMLQPSYNRLIRRDLTSTLSAAVNLLNRAQAEGVPFYTYEVIDGVEIKRMSDEMLALFNEARDNGSLVLTGRCLDVSNSNLQNLLLADDLSPRCLLHQSHESGFSAYGYGVEFEQEANGALVTLFRAKVQDAGYHSDTLDGSQMVMGSTAAGGEFIVLVSANLERIPQATNVLKSLLMPLSIALILFSMSCAWSFSLWFTRPLQRLSTAARQMAKGNFDVEVLAIGNDEIATLTKDFNRMAKAVKRSLDVQKDLLANVSHDLRTPLTLIKGYAETVRDLTGDNEEKRTEQLNVIVDETDRLSALVNSVMELSRMSSGAEKPELVRFDLYQMCDEVSYRYLAICEQNGYTFDFAGDDDSYIVADPALLERALHNLLGNALKHVGDDGYLGLHVNKTATGMARVEVIDHGPGIPEEDIPYLFDRYYRSRSDEGRAGTGLGLSIVKAIMTAHNFHFGVESKIGQGSVFWFEAPLAEEPAQKGKEKAAENEKESRAAKRKSKNPPAKK